MPSPSITPHEVIFAHRESVPPSPAKKYAPLLVPIQPSFVPFVIGFWKVARQSNNQTCGLGAIGFAFDDFSQSGPSLL